MKSTERIEQRRYTVKGMNSLIAYAASLVLTGVPPLVCESVLDGLYCSVRKSLGRVKV